MNLRTLLACTAVFGLLTACQGNQDPQQARQDVREAETQAIEDVSEAKEQAAQDVQETREEAREDIQGAREDLAEAQQQDQQQQGQAEREPAGQQGQVQVTREQCARLAMEREIKPENRHLYEACADLEEREGGNQ
jgi:vacuolar-type H+-ATPase subunit H